MGKECACLSVVLVLVFTAVRVGVRILLMGKDCACFSVVLVLCSSCAHWCTDTAYGQGLRFLSVVLVLRASCAHWCVDTAYGQGLRVFLRGPGAARRHPCHGADADSHGPFYLETLQLQYMTRWSTLCPCCAGLQVPGAVVDVSVETSPLFSLRTSFPGDVVVETVELSQLPLLRKSSSPGGPGQGCRHARWRADMGQLIAVIMS